MKDIVPVRTFDRVVKDELAQIRRRREIAEVAEVGLTGSAEATTAEGDAQRCRLSESLVGVSLSGGGVRSGAVSLGFLMGLARHRVLRCVDYLSTVSGGGYAGAAMSAEAERTLRLRSKSASPALNSDAAMLFREGRDETHEEFVRTPQQLRRLISNSNYLIKNRGWASRAALGIVALGTMIFCSILCVASLAAYGFRSLFAPEIYDYYHCLGFRGDVWVAMSPSCLLFMFWLICWGLSFVDHKRQAEGLIARYVFTAWVIVSVIGLTLIATTGDVDFGTLLSSVGFSESTWQSLGEFGNWLKVAIVSAIGMSLLPYFKPRMLLQSGREKGPGPRKFLFNLARNGLLFGVPLLLFAFMARENISDWNELRDHRIVQQDLNLIEPLGGPASHFRLFYECEAALSSASTPPERSLSSTLAEVFNWDGIDMEPGWPGKSVQSREVLRAARRHLATYLLKSDPGLNDDLLAYEKSERDSRSFNAANLTHSVWAEQTFGTEATEKTKFERTADFGQFLIAKTINNTSNPTHLTPFGEMLKSQRTFRSMGRRIVWRLNRLLLNPDLCTHLKNDLDLSVADLNGTPSEIAQVERLMVAFRDAKALENHLKPDFIEKRASQAPNGQVHQVAPSDTVEQILSKYGLSRFEDSKKISQATEAAISRVEKEPSSTTSLFLTDSFDSKKESVDSDAAAKYEFEIRRQSAARALLAINRELVSAAFPGCIVPRDASAPVYNMVVFEKDQETRRMVLFWSFIAALVGSLVIDLNASSWHGFYAKQLSSFWVQAGNGSQSDIDLNSLNTTEVGRPYHLINAAVWFPGQPDIGEDALRDENPDEFLLSTLYCGSDHSGIGFVPTGDSAFSDLTLGDAIALSGAAVTPLSTRNNLVQVLLLVLNFRTGLWLPNPGTSRRGQVKSILDRMDAHIFSPLRWLCLRLLPQFHDGGFRARPPQNWSHLLVTDGGHYENLGIEALLVRRCPLIIAVDATEDPNYEFDSLATAIRRLRVAHRIRFVVPGTNIPVQFPDEVTPETGSGFSEKRFLPIEVRYPSPEGEDGSDSGQKGLIILVKSAVAKDDPLELVAYKKQNPEFPNHPTSDQFFDAERFEAYRYLGRTAAADLVDELFGEERPGFLNSPIDLIKRAFEKFKVSSSPVVVEAPELDQSQLVIDGIDAFIQQLSDEFEILDADRKLHYLEKVSADLTLLKDLTAECPEGDGLITHRWPVPNRLPQALAELAATIDGNQSPQVALTRDKTASQEPRGITSDNQIVHAALKALQKALPFVDVNDIETHEIRELLKPIEGRIESRQPYCRAIVSTLNGIRGLLDKLESQKVSP